MSKEPACEHIYTKALLGAVRELDDPKLRRSARPHPTGSRVLAVTSVTKSFGGGGSDHGVLALDRASFELRTGENLGIIGESGSGKTTLGRCIQRIYEVNEGSVDLVGRDGTARDLASSGPDQLRFQWRDLRLVFQTPFLAQS